MPRRPKGVRILACTEGFSKEDRNTVHAALPGTRRTLCGKFVFSFDTHNWRTLWNDRHTHKTLAQGKRFCSTCRKNVLSGDVGNLVLTTS